jgi:predicted nucleic acid-binding protein
VGATSDQQKFWDTFFAKLQLLDFDSRCAKKAVEIQKQLKKKNQMIAIPDLLIGATAKTNDLKLATMNTSHFKRIASLQIVDK